MSNGEPLTYNLIVFGTQSRFQPARIDPLLDSERVFSWMFEMEARPTEYKGVLYRSKCEAMFARWLDLSGKGQFFYEPIGFPKCVDFVAIEHCAEMIPYGIIMHPSYIAVQYKPSKPSRAYLAEMDRQKAAIQEACELIHPGQVLICLMYGSAWNDSRGMFVFPEEGDPYHVDKDWLAPCLNDLLAYRYDLEEVV